MKLAAKRQKTEESSWRTWITNSFIRIKYILYTHIEALEVAIATNDIKAVKYFANATDVNRKYKYGDTPLYKAICNAHDEIVQILIERGAEVNAQDEAGDTPLHAAIDLNQAEIARILVEGGAEVNTQNRDGTTPLHEAIFHGRDEIARKLIKHDADINAQNKDGSTPLHAAIFHGRAEIVQILVGEGRVDINAQNDHGATPLHDAVVCIDRDNSPQIEMVKQLIKLGADVNVRDINKQTPLEESASCGRLAAVRCLLSLSEFTENKEECGEALASNDNVTLHQAVIAIDVELVRQLLTHPEVAIAVFDEELLEAANRGENQEIIDMLHESQLENDLRSGRTFLPQQQLARENSNAELPTNANTGDEPSSSSRYNHRPS